MPPRMPTSTLRLWMALKPRLVAERMTTSTRRWSGRWCRCWRGMEPRGIKVDRQILSRLSRRVRAEAGAARGRDLRARRRAVQHRLAQAARRHPVRQARPAGRHEDQDRRLVDRRRRARGARRRRATSCRATILDWRQLSKLKCTYTDALPALHQPARPAACTPPTRWPSTTTGRLSSTDPNLQNIPIRTEEGRKIRTAFIAEHGHEADLAPTTARSSCACSPTSPTSRSSSRPSPTGVDIHAMTASEMFGVPVEGMPRRRAPPRQGDQLRHHLRHLGLRPRQPARHRRARRPAPTSRRYFERFPGIRDYMDATQGAARASTASSSTLFGRKIHFPQINSQEPGRARRRRARGDQRADPGHGGRHHPPRDDPHAPAR